MTVLKTFLILLCFMNTVHSFSFLSLKVPKNKFITQNKYRQSGLVVTKKSESRDVSTAAAMFYAFSLLLDRNQSMVMSSFSSLAIEKLDKEKERKKKRFDRSATTSAHVDLPCILKIYGKKYNMTTWAKAHPGGSKVLQKFHSGDATKAFEAADHSAHAHEMLKDFEIVDGFDVSSIRGINDTRVIAMDIVGSDVDASTPSVKIAKPKRNNRSRWKRKLFTAEDPVGIHKYTGMFVLLHFVYRFSQMCFGDKTAGFGTRTMAARTGGAGQARLPPKTIAPLCLIPHCVLSLTSFQFRTVPQERVVGKPMIWKEYRVHNAGFALRSVAASSLAWLSIAKGHEKSWRKLAVIGTCLVVLGAQIVADFATSRLRHTERESTTATMPYWAGCSLETQKKFKHFYAYCQFMATLACLAVSNPAWGFSVLLPIQLASLLMTLVRKGILSARGYHMGYTVSLAMPFLVGFRSCGVLGFIPHMAFGALLYRLRCHGMNKYALWLPVIVGRIAFGDRILNYQSW